MQLWLAISHPNPHRLSLISVPTFTRSWDRITSTASSSHLLFISKACTANANLRLDSAPNLGARILVATAFAYGSGS